MKYKARRPRDIETPGGRLYKAREERGLLIYQLAYRANVTDSNLINYELNRVIPSVLAAARICKILDCTLDDIWGEK